MVCGGRQNQYLIADSIKNEIGLILSNLLSSCNKNDHSHCFKNVHTAMTQIFQWLKKVSNHSTGRKGQITVVACGSATGQVILPTVILKPNL